MTKKTSLFLIMNISFISSKAATLSETIANTSAEQFRQEFECDFVGSINTLLSATKLRTMPFKPPIESHINFLY